MGLGKSDFLTIRRAFPSSQSIAPELSYPPEVYKYIKTGKKKKKKLRR